MSFAEFEVILIEQLNDMLYVNFKPANISHYKDHDQIRLCWTQPDKSEIDFIIDMNHDFSYIHYYLSIYNIDAEDGVHHSNGGCDVPHSEEEHFQLSTVQDLGFSWEFYQYIVDVFKKIKE